MLYIMVNFLSKKFTIIIFEIQTGVSRQVMFLATKNCNNKMLSIDLL